MMKPFALALFAASLFACSADATEDTASSEDAVVGGPAGDFAYVAPEPEEEPLPEFDGTGPDSKLRGKDVLQSSAQLNVKVGFEVPQPKY